MQPLLFLTYRSLVNGLKRSVTSPKRLITTIVIILYYFWWFVRPFITGGGMRFNGGAGPFDAQFEFPPLQTLDAFVFAGFAALSLVLALGIFGYRASFKPADVDVLFPTPVSPRLVLLFRIVRDYLATLLVPLILIVFTWKPLQIERFFRDIPHPQSSGYALRILTLGFILLSTTWVGIGYALSLYVNRNDRNSQTRKRIIGWAIALPCLVVIGYTALSSTEFHSLGDFVQFTQQKWLRAFFFTATPAARMVMGPLEGSILQSAMGAGVLVGISGLGLYLALAQAEWMYDQAAVKGFGSETIRQLQKRGDIMGVMAEAARQGRLKPRRTGWFQRLRTRGFGALLWKDALIQWRSIRAMVFLFLLVGLMFVVMPYFAGLRGRREGTGYMLLIMQGFVAFMVATITSQSGFTELLRRVDLQKPLPFRPQTIVASEVLAKALPSILVPLVCSVVGLILYPRAWAQVLAGSIFYPCLVCVISALVCVIVLLFPEIDDPSQRGFRGIMMLFGLLIVGMPGVGGFLVVTVFLHAPVVGAIVGGILNLIVAGVLTVVGGSLYAGFNPSE